MSRRRRTKQSVRHPGAGNPILPGDYFIPYHGEMGREIQNTGIRTRGAFPPARPPPPPPRRSLTAAPANGRRDSRTAPHERDMREWGAQHWCTIVVVPGRAAAHQSF